MDKIDKYVVTQSKKIISSIEKLRDFSSFPVHEPNTKSGVHAMTTVSRWIDWFRDETCFYGQSHIDGEVLYLLGQINSTLNITMDRANESFRYLLHTIDKLEIENNELKEKYEPLPEPRKEPELLSEALEKPAVEEQENSDEDLDEPEE